jgi:RNA-dependent RNA polymerase
MEFDIRYIDFDASYVEVVKAFEAVLHGPDLYDPDDPKAKGRLPNFKIEWHENEAGGAGSNGTSKLIVATRRIGERLLAWYREENNSIRVCDKKMRIYPCRGKVSKALKLTLEKGLYVGPEKQVARDEILQKLHAYLRVDKVQFGVWFKPDPASPTRSFSTEWERGYIEQSEAYLSIGYDHKVIIIDVCSTACLIPFIY